ncbi:MAG TPA: hypothetical protein ENI87_10625 [bacterium]|nr:hypothetical protein [bacterium]
MTDDGGSFFFQLRTGDGEVILRGLGTTSKIMTQNEILHARNSLREEERLVPHQADDGKWFAVLKDRDGSVLARSPRVEGREQLEALVERLQRHAGAPMVDLSKHRSAS